MTHGTNLFDFHKVKQIHTDLSPYYSIVENIKKTETHDLFKSVERFTRVEVDNKTDFNRRDDIEIYNSHDIHVQLVLGGLPTFVSICFNKSLVLYGMFLVDGNCEGVVGREW